MIRLEPRESPDRRCSFCLASPGPEGLRRCSACGTEIHPGCLTELGRCPTLGCANPAPLAPRRPFEIPNLGRNDFLERGLISPPFRDIELSERAALRRVLVLFAGACALAVLTYYVPGLRTVSALLAGLAGFFFGGGPPRRRP